MLGMLQLEVPVSRFFLEHVPLIKILLPNPHRRLEGAITLAVQPSTCRSQHLLLKVMA